MIKLKNMFRLAAAIMLIASATACNKFLDAPSPMQLKQDEVLSTAQGFNEALTSVYLQMGGSNMYGKELTMGFLSVLARSYDTTITVKAGDLYYQGAQYNMNHASVRALTDKIWATAYNSILGVNNVLGQIDAHRDLFSQQEFNNLKGEAYALRAFLHFELLRMYGPAAPAQHLADAAIPYVKNVSPYAEKTATVQGIFDACLADLMQARTLFDPKQVRRSHLDYWSATALLSRIYLYKGDVTNAKSMAAEVINSKLFPLAINNNDVAFANEQIFSLLIFQTNLLSYQSSSFGTSTPLGLQPANQTVLYVNNNGSTNDWRKLNAFLDPLSNLTTNFTNPNAVCMPKKLASTTLFNYNGLPLIRLSEMYYIAAECALANGQLTEGTTLLDSIRVHRNLPVYTQPALTADVLAAEIEREYRKEMLGEGQVFFYYKRKNTPFADLPFTKVPPVTDASYQFVKPE